MMTAAAATAPAAPAVLVGLGGSVAGVSYQLVNGVSVVGAPVGGTRRIAPASACRQPPVPCTVVATNINHRLPRQYVRHIHGSDQPAAGSHYVVPWRCASLPLMTEDGCQQRRRMEQQHHHGSHGNPTSPAGGGNSTSRCVTTGTTTITYTLPTACTVTEVVTVSLSPTGISGPASVCAGTTAALSDAVVSGGSWTSSSDGHGHWCRLPHGSTVSGAAPGTVTIDLLLGTGCTVTKAMTVSLAPSPISSITAVCISGTTTLSDPHRRRHVDQHYHCPCHSNGRWYGNRGQTRVIDTIEIHPWRLCSMDTGDGKPHPHGHHGHSASAYARAAGYYI